MSVTELVDWLCIVNWLW